MSLKLPNKNPLKLSTKLNHSNWPTKLYMESRSNNLPNKRSEVHNTRARNYLRQSNFYKFNYCMNKKKL